MPENLEMLKFLLNKEIFLVIQTLIDKEDNFFLFSKADEWNIYSVTKGISRKSLYMFMFMSNKTKVADIMIQLLIKRKFTFDAKSGNTYLKWIQ